MGLEGKTALVTGAGRGIGRAIVLTLADQGADVVLCDVSPQSIRAVAAEVEAKGRSALPVEASVADRAQVAALIVEAVARFGKIDILVNNAGIRIDGWFIDSMEDEWDRLIAVNLKGVMICCQAALKEMIPRRFGRIINIASDAARMGQVMEAAYGATKGGVVSFTKALAREVGRHQITVNAVSPGVVVTEMSRPVMERNPQAADAMIKSLPLRRAGQPEDIAAAVAFLASDAASYITGQTLSVNGGLVVA